MVQTTKAIALEQTTHQLAPNVFACRQFTQAIVRQPALSLAAGITTQQLGTPDIELARQQHALYIEALESLGVTVTVLDALEEYPDSCFVEDVAIIHKGTAIITRPAATSRRSEINYIRELLAAKMSIVELCDCDDAFVDGGDVLIHEDRVLIGLSQRTNSQGARWLAQRLYEIDATVQVTTVPLSGVLHLKTGMTALAPGLLLRDPACSIATQFDFATMTVLPTIEGYAADVVPVNDGIIITKGFPTVAAIAHESYARVIELDMSEFRKMDGSLTCLSLLW